MKSLPVLAITTLIIALGVTYAISETPTSSAQVKPPTTRIDFATRSVIWPPREWGQSDFLVDVEAKFGSPCDTVPAVFETVTLKLVLPADSTGFPIPTPTDTRLTSLVSLYVWIVARNNSGGLPMMDGTGFQGHCMDSLPSTGGRSPSESAGKWPVFYGMATTSVFVGGFLLAFARKHTP